MGNLRTPESVRELQKKLYLKSKGERLQLSGVQFPDSMEREEGQETVLYPAVAGSPEGAEREDSTDNEKATGESKAGDTGVESSSKRVDKLLSVRESIKSPEQDTLLYGK